jgi:hypothetical protein
MERVWLATTYYMDPAVEALSPNAERLMTRAIAYCGNSESSGYITAKALKNLGIPAAKARTLELLSARILVETGCVDLYQFRSWDRWQKEGNALVKRKKNDAERQARHREQQRKQDQMSRDTSRDVTPLEKRREEENSKEFSSSTHLSTARDEQPRGPAVPVNAWKLVRDVIPNEHPQAVKTDLALRASALMNAGTAEGTVRAALELWITKPNLGPAVLPSLVSEVIKTAAPIHAVPNGAHNLGPASQKAAGWLAVGQNLTNPHRPKELE